MTANQSAAPKTNASHSVVAVLGWLVIVCSTYVVLLALLAGPHFFGHKIKAGEIAEEDLRAPKKMLIVDKVKTREKQDALKNEVAPVMKRNAAVAKEISVHCRELLERVAALRQILPLSPPPNFSADEQVFLMQLPEKEWRDLQDKLISGESLSGAEPAPSVSRKLLGVSGKNHKQKASKTTVPSSLSAVLSSIEHKRQEYAGLGPQSYPAENEKAVLFIAATLPVEEWSGFRESTESSLNRFLTNVCLFPYATLRQWELEFSEFLSDKLSPRLRQEVARLFAGQFSVDMQIDYAATEKQLKKAAAAIKPVMKEIAAGTIIVSKGSIVQDDDVSTLASIGVTKVQKPGLVLGLAIALFTAYGLLGIFLYTYEPKVFFAPSAIALMGTVLIITCAVALFVGGQFPQFIPLPAATLLLSVTYGKRVTVILMALIVTFLAMGEILTGPYLVALATGSIMALGASIAKRNNMMLTGFLIGLMQMLGYFAAIVIMGVGDVNLGRELPLQMLGGLSSAIVAIGSLPFLENIFGILTPFRVAELAEPDQPLMRQLEENAPGTYQHSLAVANLAEGGARAIGADVNLVRTGAMYHDIGKMVTPRYFIENQLGDKNPHDVIPPEESRAKVLAHVTNGLALAQKYGLPKAVQAFIPEHQGTTIMAYFYHKACLRDGADNVDPLYYRYPGPKPQTRETAVVMLADVAEAVTHSMKDPSQEEVEATISNVFKARWEDEQFSESGLTAEELEKVKKGFVRVWRTLHHDRLKYPSTTTGRMAVPPVAVPSTEPSVAPVAPDTSVAPDSDAPDRDGDCC